MTASGTVRRVTRPVPTATLVAVCIALLLPASSGAARPLPSPVGGVAAVAVPGGAEVKWRAPTGDRLRRIVVERRTASERVWRVAVSLPVSRRSAKLALLPGERTELRVRARNRFGFGRSSRRRVFVTALAMTALPKAEESPAVADPPKVPTGTLPVMRIDTEGGVPIVDRENYIDGEWELRPLTDGGTSGELEIRGRGQSSWSLAPKKPYRLKLKSKQPLLGMTSNRHFALLADYFDPTSMRNQIAWLFGSASTLGWMPAIRHVELMLNGSYAGLYSLVEVIRLEDDRAQGDWLLEIDGHHLREPDPQGFVTTAGRPVVVKEPEDAEETELSEIQSHVQEFEDVLMGPDFADPVNGYAKHIDVASWVDWYVIEELLFNHDAMWGSTYITVSEDDGLLRMGPLWDHDQTLGTNFESMLGTGTPHLPTQPHFGTRVEHVWVVRLMQDPIFAGLVDARWQQLREVVESAVELIDEQQIALAAAAQLSFAQWGQNALFADEVDAIRSFLTTRKAHLDSEGF